LNNSTNPKQRPVALITGASRGIGRGIALELARTGYNIVGNATSFNLESGKGLAEVKLAVEAHGASFAPAPADISDLGSHAGLMDVALCEFGRIDLLVNNAGVAPEERRDVLETTPESYDRVQNINCRGAFFLTQLIARQMLTQIGCDRAGLSGISEPLQPVIIFITSISANTSSTERAEYCVSKAALSQTSQIFADRLAAFNINVFEIRPGIIRTDMTNAVAAEYHTRIGRGLVPQGRWGLPADIGRVVVSLAGGDFGFVTGQVIEVSGGMNIRRL
jgi:3-oxoacyl-[acyl-carrier protein] reductase